MCIGDDEVGARHNIVVHMLHSTCGETDRGRDMVEGLRCCRHSTVGCILCGKTVVVQVQHGFPPYAMDLCTRVAHGCAC